jgi:imidazoleglycerol-phosphate dehydratase
MSRVSQITRNTKETQIELRLDLDGQGVSQIQTGVGFFDHMLTLFAHHSRVDLTIEAHGDLVIDAHHTVEDVGIALGLAIKEALGDKSGIRRYGHFTLPMEETLCTTALDLSGRPYLVFQAEMKSQQLGNFETELVEDFWQAIANNAGMNLHILVQYGRNTHHVCEAIFKATARALRMAVEEDPRALGIPSTKGTL